MPLFDASVPRRLLWPIDAPWPRRRARALVAKFQSRFPEILYDIDLDVELANAQAFIKDGRKRVRLYGGLVRHRRIGSAGLAVALAHETGHHMGGEPYLQFYHWLSSEERATEWAVAVGLPRVFGRRICGRVAKRGVEQLRSIGVVE
jgi:hypothetical protein